ncbi:hypothetical protein GCM10022245_73540 [Streptomyces mayteni]
MEARTRSANAPARARGRPAAGASPRSADGPADGRSCAAPRQLPAAPGPASGWAGNPQPEAGEGGWVGENPSLRPPRRARSAGVPAPPGSGRAAAPGRSGGKGGWVG